jgi:hypothetical protein
MASEGLLAKRRRLHAEATRKVAADSKDDAVVAAWRDWFLSVGVQGKDGAGGANGLDGKDGLDRPAPLAWMARTGATARTAGPGATVPTGAMVPTARTGAMACGSCAVLHSTRARVLSHGSRV